MAAKKKNLTDAISRGADLFFSANDAHEGQESNEVNQAYQPQETHEVHEESEARKPRRAQEVSLEELASTVEAMKAATEADEARKRAAAEARRTQGRKGYAMPRLNISLTPSGYEYVQIMARISGKSVTRFISDLVDKDAEKNKDRFRRAKEVLEDE